MTTPRFCVDSEMLLRDDATRHVHLGELLRRTQPQSSGSWWNSVSAPAGLQSGLDVDETLSETSDCCLSVPGISVLQSCLKSRQNFDVFGPLNFRGRAPNFWRINLGTWNCGEVCWRLGKQPTKLSDEKRKKHHKKRMAGRPEKNPF